MSVPLIPAHGQDKPTLRLVQTIPLSGVSGRLDHMAVDLEKKRLFVAAVANGTLEVLDLDAGKAINSISGIKDTQDALFLGGQFNKLYVSSLDGTLRIFQGETFRLIQALGSLDTRVRARTMNTYSNLALQSTISSQGRFELKLEENRLPFPAADEIVVQMEAAPVNPADLLGMFGPVDKSSLVADGTPDNPILRGQVPESRLASVAARWDRPIFLGNEGAGTVVDAGGDAKELVGRKSRPPRRNV
jgi:hypothetical protein